MTIFDYVLMAIWITHVTLYIYAVVKAPLPGMIQANTIGNLIFWGCPLTVLYRVFG